MTQAGKKPASKSTGKPAHKLSSGGAASKKATAPKQGSPSPKSGGPKTAQHVRPAYAIDKSKNEPKPRIRLKFVTSAADLGGCPKDGKPEVALVGRSNSGKSSLLNGIGMERVAKISSSPGKTRLLNFFDAGHSYRLVDMPGYGFSHRPGEEHHGWKKMIEAYLTGRKNLCGLLLLMDVRRDWTPDEQLMLEWVKPLGIPIAVIATKVDKLSKNELAKRIKAIKAGSGIEQIFSTSSLKKVGFDELEDFIFRTWIKPNL